MGGQMVIRDEHTPYYSGPKPQRPRRSRNRRRALYAGGAVVVVAAGVFIGVHAFTGTSTSTSTSPSASAGASASASTGTGTASRSPVSVAGPPMAGASHAGKLELTATGSQLAGWNQTSSGCSGSVSGEPWQVGNGKVAVNSSGEVTLTTNGTPGSCVSLVSPQAISSGVVEADIDFPALPGKPNTIANWTAFWMTNQNNWPNSGEIDAVESEPATGVNAVAYHWGTPNSPQEVSTDGFAPDGTLPKYGPNIGPGWHVVDIVYTKGYFAVYYDGKLFTRGSDSAITGAPINVLISSSVTPDTQSVQQQIGAAPVNSDSSPATITVKYVKIWAYK